MKLLTVDVGNTSTALGVWRAGRVSRVVHCDGTFDEAAEAALRLAATGVDAIAYLSVVPDADANWQRFAEAHTLNLVQVDYRLFAKKGGVYKGLTLDYPHPETIGADRLADAAAAMNRYGAPVIVCDFGTAFTAAVITADGVWRGGVIAPGFPLMRDYLYERTAKLPRMKIGGGEPRIGRSTEEAMRFGALVGYRGMVREIVNTLKRNFATDFRCVATGGFAKWVLRSVDIPFTIDPTLTLHGAGLLAAERVRSEECGVRNEE